MVIEDRRAARRLETFRQLLAHIQACVLPDVGFVLWDNSTVPCDLAPDALAFVIADEGVVAALVRKPSFHTFLNLWVTSRIDLRNGSFMDLPARRPKERIKKLAKHIDKHLLLTTVARFLFVARGGPWPLEKIRGDKARADGSEAANKENVSYHYDLSNAFYELFLDPEMVYTCAYFKNWKNDLATAQRDNSTSSVASCASSQARPFSTLAAAGARSFATRLKITAFARMVLRCRKSSSPTPRKRLRG